MLTLYIGNKNTSSWSLRPWLAMQVLGIPFQEVQLRFDDFAPQSPFKRTLLALAPTGQVPLLVDKGFAVWDSLAIAEYLHERHPDAGVWPQAMADRARARSLCAEMHSGLSALRQHCPMNIQTAQPARGQQIWAAQAAVRTDVQRIVAMWREQLATHGGPFLFGRFGMVDAFFAPVCLRLHGYGLPVPTQVHAYIERILALPALQQWCAAAAVEQDLRQLTTPPHPRP